MLIDPAVWPKLHGASTHFPVAMAMAAALFESIGFFLPDTSRRKGGLHAAGYYSIVLGALGTFPAVLSGLFMTRAKRLGTAPYSFIISSSGLPSPCWLGWVSGESWSGIISRAGASVSISSCCS